MFGEARYRDEPSALAALVESAAGRMRGALHAVWGAAQARFNLPLPAPRAPEGGAGVIPTVRYRDVPAAIKWLSRAFGMKVHRVVTDANGAACYAELTIGSGMLMIAPIEDTAFGKLMVQPDEIGGVETQVCYLCVANARAHYARAKAAGAVIVLDPDDEANQGRGYSCRDPEGHVWNFGTYDPWQKQAAAPCAAKGLGLRRLNQGAAALVLLGLGVVLVPQLLPQPSARAGTAVTEPELRAPLAPDEPRQEAVAPAVQDAAAPAVEAHNALLETAQSKAAEARSQLAEARRALEKATREAVAARAEIDELQRARKAAERAAVEAREHLAAAQSAVERVRQEAALERAKRLAAERARTARRVHSARPRLRWSRTWCYSSTGPNPAPSSTARLVGFCRG